MTKSNTKSFVCAGIDVAKATLSYALTQGGASECANTVEGRSEMIAFFKSRGVRRVGLESTGSYHFAAAEDLRAAGFEVVVLQPMQVKAYAKFKLQRAKSDAIDANLIARCTEECDDPRAAADARLAPLAEHLTMIEHLADDIARAKTRRDRYRDPRLRELIETDIKEKTALKKAEMQRLLKAVRAHKDLARKLELLFSIEGFCTSFRQKPWGCGYRGVAPRALARAPPPPPRPPFNGTPP
jgi:transposase